jgi:hypothetical protein
MKLGSTAHKQLFCETFLKTHRTFEPDTLPWPELDQESLAKLRAIPFWVTAIGVERRAGIMVAKFADTLEDPQIREAVALQGYEEARHGRLMRALFDRYGLPVEEPPLGTIDVRRQSFVDFGYEECLDSFAGFGIFRLAREMNWLPRPLLDIFSVLLEEEARHITFFVNWIAYEDHRAGKTALQRFTGSIMNYGRAVGRLVQTFGGDATSTGFVSTGVEAVVADVTPAMFIEACLAENRRVMEMFPPGLVKPRVMPTLAALALTAIRALPPRTAVSSPASKAASAEPADELESRREERKIA